MEGCATKDTQCSSPCEQCPYLSIAARHMHEMERDTLWVCRVCRVSLPGWRGLEVALMDHQGRCQVLSPQDMGMSPLTDRCVSRVTAGDMADPSLCPWMMMMISNGYISHGLLHCCFMSQFLPALSP